MAVVAPVSYSYRTEFCHLRVCLFYSLWWKNANLIFFSVLLFLFHYLNYTIAIVNNFPHVSSFRVFFSLSNFFCLIRPLFFLSYMSTWLPFKFLAIFFHLLSNRLDNHFIKWHKCWILNRYKLWKLCSYVLVDSHEFKGYAHGWFQYTAKKNEREIKSNKLLNVCRFKIKSNKIFGTMGGDRVWKVTPAIGVCSFFIVW